MLVTLLIIYVVGGIVVWVVGYSPGDKVIRHRTILLHALVWPIVFVLEIIQLMGSRGKGDFDER